jgi:predicted nucleic acid-binding Zn ribbon protein
MAKKNDVKLGEALKELLETYRLSSKLDEVNLINKWPDVVGSMIDKHTTKIHIHQNTLYVTLDSAALKQELSFSKTILMNNLNQAVGKEVISAIVFK